MSIERLIASSLVTKQLSIWGVSFSFPLYLTPTFLVFFFPTKKLARRHVKVN